MSFRVQVETMPIWGESSWASSIAAMASSTTLGSRHFQTRDMQRYAEILRAFSAKSKFIWSFDSFDVQQCVHCVTDLLSRLESIWVNCKVERPFIASPSYCSHCPLLLQFLLKEDILSRIRNGKQETLDSLDCQTIQCRYNIKKKARRKAQCCTICVEARLHHDNKGRFPWTKAFRKK